MKRPRSPHRVEDLLRNLVDGLHDIVGKDKVCRRKDLRALFDGCDADDRRGDEVMLFRPGDSERHGRHARLFRDLHDPCRRFLARAARQSD